MRITEIFPSIIGEGSHMGKQAIFVRFFGCRMGCEFCDTPQGRDADNYQHMDMTIADVVVQVHDIRKKTGVSLIVLTGGEPGEQYAELNDLARELAQRDFTLHLETNGEHKGVLYSIFHHVTLSPKSNNIAWDKFPLAQSLEFKFLHDPENPCTSVSFIVGVRTTAKQRYAYDIPTVIQIMDHHYSPMEQLEHLKSIIVNNTYTNVRYLPQLHKLLTLR